MTSEYFNTYKSSCNIIDNPIKNIKFEVIGDGVSDRVRGSEGD